MLQQAEHNYNISSILRAVEVELPRQQERAARFTGIDDNRLQTAKRVFSLVPLVVFFVTLALFAGQAEHSFTSFAEVLLRVIATSLASSLVCIAAYGFYCYMQDKSYGL